MTKIEWVKNADGMQGKTWNPITGCTKISDGCKNCYAERMAKRLAGRYGYPKGEPFKVTRHDDRLGQPLKWRKPQTVFVCSMGDLFHEEVDGGILCTIFDIMIVAEKHTFLILTKRPKRMQEFMTTCIQGGVIENIWLGVTAENQETANERIPILLSTPAAKRFVSVEPMLGPVDLRSIHMGIGGKGRFTLNALDGMEEYDGEIVDTHNRLDWVICGGETGPGARPMNPDWARSLRDQCQKANVPFFFKQWGEWSPWDAWDGDTACMWTETKLDTHFFSDDNWVARVGRKRSGRLLDRCEWNEMPERECR